MIRGCLHVAIGGAPCERDGAPCAWCDPCARRFLLGLDGAREPVEVAYLAGYAQGWADRIGRKAYADLPGLADWLAAIEPGRLESRATPCPGKK